MNGNKTESRSRSSDRFTPVNDLQTPASSAGFAYPDRFTGDHAAMRGRPWFGRTSVAAPPNLGSKFAASCAAVFIVLLLCLLAATRADARVTKVQAAEATARFIKYAYTHDPATTGILGWEVTGCKRGRRTFHCSDHMWGDGDTGFVDAFTGSPLIGPYEVTSVYYVSGSCRRTRVDDTEFGLTRFYNVCGEGVER